jgi:thiol:disulfide interchange protein DsbC
VERSVTSAYAAGKVRSGVNLTQRILLIMKTYVKCLAGALCVVLSAASFGQPTAKDDSLAAIKAAINATLQKGKPGLAVTDVEKSPINGLYKATIGGSHIYTTADGQYFINGDVYQIKPGEIVNLTEKSRNGDRAKAVASVDKKDTIIFSPKDKVKKVVYVFTDVDCHFCQVLHSHMAEYNSLGIEVRYLAYPRAGLDSDSASKLVSAWCSDDRKAALTKLKLQQAIAPKTCSNPVATQYTIGQSIGLTGTPALILEDGELISGYMEPAKLAEALKI